MRIVKILLIFVLAFYSLGLDLRGQELNRQLCSQVDHWLDGQIAGLINDFKKTENGSIFLKNHSEEGLRKSILFLQCPEDHFKAIQSLPDLCANIWAIQLLFFDLKDRGQEPELCDFFRFLRGNFEKANAQNVPILTYLILVCDKGVLSESLAERYTRLFEFQYDLFVKDLKQRTDWRDVVRSIMAGDWRAFSAGLSKLGTSEFELELKKYVASLIKRG